MDATHRASALADRFWEETLELEPLLGTIVGDDRFDDRLPDPTEAGRERSRAVQERALAELAPIDRTELDMVLRTTLDVVEAIAKRALSDLDNRLDRLAVASHLWGPANLVAELASIQAADTPERLERYVARLHAIPAYLAGVIETVEEGPRVGVTSPRGIASLRRSATS